MPNGLSDGLSVDDFVDIIAYLESLRDPAAEASPVSQDGS
jgi:hypothetical protein